MPNEYTQNNNIFQLQIFPMHYIRWFFGGSSNQADASSTKPDPDKLQKKIQDEKTRIQLELQVKEAEDREKKIQAQYDRIYQKVKQYTRENNEKQRLKYLQQAKNIQTKLQNARRAKEILQNTLNNLEQADMAIDVVGAVQTANQKLSEQQKYKAKLYDIVLEQKEREKQNAIMDCQIKNLLEDTEEDCQAKDDIMKEIERELAREKMQNGKEVPAKQIKAKVPQQSFKDLEEKDKIEQLLSQL